MVCHVRDQHVDALHTPGEQRVGRLFRGRGSRSSSKAGREQIFDALRAEAGWSLDPDREREYLVTQMPSKEGKGFVGHLLRGADGLPWAVVEAYAARDLVPIDHERGQHRVDGVLVEEEPGSLSTRSASPASSSTSSRPTA